MNSAKIYGINKAIDILKKCGWTNNVASKKNIGKHCIVTALSAAVDPNLTYNADFEAIFRLILDKVGLKDEDKRLGKEWNDKQKSDVVIFEVLNSIVQDLLHEDIATFQPTITPPVHFSCAAGVMAALR